MVKRFLKIPNGIKFLLAVSAMYLAFFIFQPADSHYIEKIFLNFLIRLGEILPLMALAFFIIFLSYLWIKPEAIEKHLGAASGLKGWLYTVIGSIVIALPPYVLYPLLGDLSKNGMKYSLIATFTNNRNVQPPFIPVLVYYFGISFALIFSIYVLVFSILTGVLMGKLMAHANRR